MRQIKREQVFVFKYNEFGHPVHTISLFGAQRIGVNKNGVPLDYHAENFLNMICEWGIMKAEDYSLVLVEETNTREMAIISEEVR